jgi:sugar fermentation stimulation protein A
VEFPELVFGQLIKRYKRFLADVRLDSGEFVTAHCANPGSMKSLLEPAPRVWLSRAREGRKLPYTWEVAETPQARIYVNPVGANRVVAEALQAGKIPELSGYETIKPEVKYGTGSRIDFLLSGPTGRAFVEVKNVTMDLGDGRSAFPDSVTVRGTKHLEELARVVIGGDRAVLLFCAARTDAMSVEAAADIDPVYSATLTRVRKLGVEVFVYSGDIDHKGFSLFRRLPFVGD